MTGRLSVPIYTSSSNTFCPCSYEGDSAMSIPRDQESSVSISASFSEAAARYEWSVPRLTLLITVTVMVTTGTGRSICAYYGSTTATCVMVELPSPKVSPASFRSDRLINPHTDFLSRTFRHVRVSLFQERIIHCLKRGTKSAKLLVVGSVFSPSGYTSSLVDSYIPNLSFDLFWIIDGYKLAYVYWIIVNDFNLKDLNIYECFFQNATQN